MLRILVISVESDGQVLAAVAELVDGEALVTPTSEHYENAAQCVRENPVIDGSGPPIPINEPERWLRALPWMYHGSRFYAALDSSEATTKITRDGALLGYIDLATGKLAAVDDELCEFVSGLEEEERGPALVAALNLIDCEVVEQSDENR